MGAFTASSTKKFCTISVSAFNCCQQRQNIREVDIEIRHVFFLEQKICTSLHRSFYMSAYKNMDQPCLVAVEGQREEGNWLKQSFVGNWETILVCTLKTVLCTVLAAQWLFYAVFMPLACFKYWYFRIFKWFYGICEPCQASLCVTNSL